MKTFFENEEVPKFNPHPFLLKFQGEFKGLNEEFETYYFQRSLAQIRFGIWICIVLYLGFGIVDYLMIRESFSRMLLIRVLFVCPCAIGVLLYSYTKSFQRIYQVVLTVLAIICSMGLIVLNLMVCNQGVYSYFLALLFSMNIVFYLFRLKFIPAMLAGGVLIVMYSLMLQFLTNVPTYIKSDSCIVFFIIILFGLISSYFFEKMERKNYFLIFHLNHAHQRALRNNVELEKKVHFRTQELHEKNEKLEIINQELAREMNEHIVSQKAVESSETNFRTLFERSTDAILLLEDEHYYDCNPATVAMLGYEDKSEIIGLTPAQLSPEYQPSGERSIDLANRIFSESKENNFMRFDWWHCHKNGTQIPMEVMLTPITYDGRHMYHILWRDVRVRKEMEARLEENSYRDSLTGIFNRRYFEKITETMDQVSYYPISLVMADVNGLKLMNDAFGHHSGDLLLKCVAQNIKKSCRDIDILARWGGDEFVVLMPNTSKVDAQKIVTRFQENLKTEQIHQIGVSVSFGVATKLLLPDNMLNMTMEDVFRIAEDEMYQRKLYEGQTLKSQTIEAISEALERLSPWEANHMKRVSNLCGRIGKVLEQSEQEIKSLETAGYFHDIGKIALDENLILCSGQFSKEERLEFIRHCEVGFRILSTVNELSEVANMILYHHERWDGLGYPRGIKGEEIPMPSRILTIADAFEAMTSQRTYKETKTKEEALVELQNCAGTQFDPNLVKILVADFGWIDN